MPLSDPNRAFADPNGDRLIGWWVLSALWRHTKTDFQRPTSKYVLERSDPEFGATKAVPPPGAMESQTTRPDVGRRLPHCRTHLAGDRSR